jgi:tetratricopeptide (TPR) repeat protein
MSSHANSDNPGGGSQPRDIESFWEYSDPVASEARFREALGAATGDDRLELMTQIARSFSLRKDFATAHGVLNEVEEQLPEAGPRPRVRYLLERGRTFNSAGDKEKARTLFLRAWELARESDEEGLAVDAAHMVAITYSGTAAGVEWNQKGLAMARGTKAAKAQALIPAMYNNMAWDLHDLKRHDEALVAFEAALVEWSARGKPRQIQVAKWSVAQGLRAAGRETEAAQIEKTLEAEGYVMNPVPVGGTPQP